MNIFEEQSEEGTDTHVTGQHRSPATLPKQGSAELTQTEVQETQEIRSSLNEFCQGLKDPLETLNRLNLLLNRSPQLVQLVGLNTNHHDTLRQFMAKLGQLFLIKPSDPAPELLATCRWVYSYIQKTPAAALAAQDLQNQISDRLLHVQGPLPNSTNYMLQMCLKLFLMDIVDHKSHRMAIHRSFWRRNASEVAGAQLTEAILLALYEIRVNGRTFIKEELPLFEITPAVLQCLSNRGSVSILKCYLAMKDNTLTAEQFAEAVYDVPNRFMLVKLPDLLELMVPSQFEQLLMQIWVQLGSRKEVESRNAYVVSKLLLQVNDGNLLVDWLERALDELFDWIISQTISELSFRLILNELIEQRSKFKGLWRLIKSKMSIRMDDLYRYPHTRYLIDARIQRLIQ